LTRPMSHFTGEERIHGATITPMVSKALRDTTSSLRSIVSGDLRYILPAIPIPKISREKDYYVKELLLFVQSLIPVEIVLLDRGFYTWGVIKVLQELHREYIILVPKHAKFKEWLTQDTGLHEHQGELNRWKRT
jgi:hypothetical protein